MALLGRPLAQILALALEHVEHPEDLADLLAVHDQVAFELADLLGDTLGEADFLALLVDAGNGRTYLADQAPLAVFLLLSHIGWAVEKHFEDLFRSEERRVMIVYR